MLNTNEREKNEWRKRKDGCGRRGYFQEGKRRERKGHKGERKRRIGRQGVGKRKAKGLGRSEWKRKKEKIKQIRFQNPFHHNDGHLNEGPPSKSVHHKSWA